MIFRRDKWWVRELERINREHARERGLLVATIARMAGAPDPAERPPLETEEPEQPVWSLTASPEQLP